MLGFHETQSAFVCPKHSCAEGSSEYQIERKVRRRRVVQSHDDISDHRIRFMPVGRDSESLGMQGHKVCVRRGIVSQNQQVHVMSCTWATVASKANAPIKQYGSEGVDTASTAVLITFRESNS